MATKKKLLQAAAGAGGAAALNVEDVFSTYLYEGNGDKQFIDNGINLGQANDGYSAYFGGSGYYVGAEQTTLTDFTVEGWIYFDNLGSNRSFFTLGYSDLQLYYRSASSNVAIYDGSAKTYSFTPSASTWYHFALVRNGTSVELFIDGVSKGTQTSSATISGDLIIGGYAGSTDPMNGYISNIRVSDNVRYSSNFTPPTSALTTDANTTLLTLQDSTFIDNSGNGNVITPSGGAEMVSHAPFTAAEAGEGGLVWTKQRSGGEWHTLGDTERGTTQYIFTNATNANFARSDGITSFNSDGYSLSNWVAHNESGANYASWTFRKAPKFFDVVTYTGNSTAGRSIAHNLGCEVGAIFVKRTDQSNDWIVYHRANTSQPETDYLSLNLTNATTDNSSRWNDTAPTTTEFTVGDNIGVNETAGTYVAYLFAHNDGDGEFGPDGDADIIKCGSYTGNGSLNGPEIDLGFEPQWLLVKRSSTGANWLIIDNMRGFVATDNNDSLLYPNLANAEASTNYYIQPTPTGFQPVNSASEVNASGSTYIYMAIRRGTKVPESGTEVFSVSTRNASEPAYTSGFPVDFALARAKDIANNWDTGSRLQQGNRIFTNLTNAEASNSNMMFDYQDGWSAGTGASTEYLSWMWKRAPGYFDVVAYTGNGVAGGTVSHNLGVAPEMMWVRKRSSASLWRVYHKGLNGGTNPEQYGINLNETAAEYDLDTLWNDTAPTASVFTLGIQGNVNGSGSPYIAYLFASLDGISKVGSYTSNGSQLNIDCGFSSGARFVLIKRTSGTGGWFVWDSERGITASNDPYLQLQSTGAEGTDNDVDIEPYSSGFTVNYGNAGINNLTGETYIFYAIA